MAWRWRLIPAGVMSRGGGWLVVNWLVVKRNWDCCKRILTALWLSMGRSLGLWAPRAWENLDCYGRFDLMSGPPERSI